MAERRKILKQLKIRTIIVSILFGVFIFGESVYSNGQIHPTGILWVLYGTLTFGFLLYFTLKFLILSINKKWRN